ncbi:MAG TPA: hypothetical protein VFN91_13470 [Myxococcaceae bacterium]|nr:hypothetical protein [Myxococcaceae bacterium]
MTALDVDASLRFVRYRSSGWLGVLLLAAACAASGRSDRPPNAAPAPSSAAISNLGFDGAVKAGSDYVAASTGVEHPKLNKSETLPSGMLQLDFDLGPGVPDPVRVTVDPNQGRVQAPEPVQQIPGITTPSKTP